ncbi:MAG: hypothetical protein WAV54_15935 [Acidimicrobiales bacterium]
MSAPEDRVAQAVRELVAFGATEPWLLSPADARRAARLWPAALVAAHRAAITRAIAAAAVLVVAGLAIAGTFSASQPGGAATHRKNDVLVEGVLRAVGGPGPDCRRLHEPPPHRCPGYIDLSGRIDLVLQPFSSAETPGGPATVYSTRSVDGRWRVAVPPGTYRVSGFTSQVKRGRELSLRRKDGCRPSRQDGRRRPVPVRSDEDGTDLQARAFEIPVVLANRGSTRQPPAIAPMTKNGSVPVTTASGSGASGGSCVRSCSQAKKRTNARLFWVTGSRMVP